MQKVIIEVAAPPKKMRNTNKVRVVVELDENDQERLAKLTATTQKPMAQVLRECLRFVYRAQIGEGDGE